MSGGTKKVFGYEPSLDGIRAIAVLHESIFSKVLRLPPLVWTGRLSYGLYLWHFPVFTFVGAWFPEMHAAGLMALKVSATFLCATISYYGLELPCLKLKKKFSVIKTRA